MGQMDKLCNMEKCNLDELAENIKDIRTALLGDEFNQNGLIHRTAKNENDIKNLYRFLYLGLGGGAVIVFLTQIVTSCK